MDHPPDQVIEAPIEFDLPATGQIPIVRVWTKQPVGKERFVEAIELRPTARSTTRTRTSGDDGPQSTREMNEYQQRPEQIAWKECDAR